MRKVCEAFGLQQVLLVHGQMTHAMRDDVEAKTCSTLANHDVTTDAIGHRAADVLVTVVNAVPCHCAFLAMDSLCQQINDRTIHSRCYRVTRSQVRANLVRNESSNLCQTNRSTVMMITLACG